MVDAKYVRLCDASFRSRIHEHGSILTFKDVDGSDTHHKPLRPSADKPSYIGTGTTVSHVGLLVGLMCIQIGLQTNCMSLQKLLKCSK